MPSLARMPSLAQTFTRETLRMFSQSIFGQSMFIRVFSQVAVIPLRHSTIHSYTLVWRSLMIIWHQLTYHKSDANLQDYMINILF